MATKIRPIVFKVSDPFPTVTSTFDTQMQRYMFATIYGGIGQYYNNMGPATNQVNTLCGQVRLIKD